MAIYMFKGTYTDASIKAMVKKPVDRSSLISKACKAFGGKLLSIYMAFGDDDVIVIAITITSSSPNAMYMDRSLPPKALQALLIKLLRSTGFFTIAFIDASV